jgi:hypothetical protein
MEDLITFYLLEQPRSVSDMIEDLTHKELGDDPDDRQEAIPRIAGNWFREGSGYLWHLEQDGIVRNSGRRYELDRDELVDRFISDLRLLRCFPDHDVHGDATVLKDAYTEIMPAYTLGEVRQRLKEDVFEGGMMADLFDFERWRDVLLVEYDQEGRIAAYRPVFTVWSAVHYALISSILKSRKSILKEYQQEEAYFRWKNRREAFAETEDRLRERIISRCFPWAELDYEDRYRDERVRAVAEGFGKEGANLPGDVLSFLTDVYLMYLDDGVGLFEQRVKHDSEESVLFDMFEVGWVIASRKLDQDEETGDYIVPLGDLNAYLDDLTYLFNSTDTLQPER